VREMAGPLFHHFTTTTTTITTMGWFDNTDAAQANNDYQNYDTSSPPESEHQASKVHELIGGAAAFEAAKAYEDHCARNGRPPTHALAKEALAGIAGAFIDREVETRGLDEVSKIEARRHAQAQIQNFNAGDLGYDNN